MRTWKILSFVMLLNVVCWAQTPPSGAESLMACLPDDTVVCIAGSGLGELKPRLEQSVIGKFAQDQGIRTFAQGIVQGVNTLVLQEADDPNLIAAALCGAKVVANCPRLLAVANEQDRQEGLGAYGMLLLDAGEHKSDVAAWVEQLEGFIGPDGWEDRTVAGSPIKQAVDIDISLYWTWVGNRFLLAVNDRPYQVLKSAQRAAWKGRAHLDQVPAHGDVMVGYIDYPGCMNLVQSALQVSDDDEIIPMVQSITRALGIHTFQQEVFRIGVVPGGLVADAMVTTSGPRQGLMGLMKPIDAEVFECVPAQSLDALALHWDVPGTYDLVMEAIKKVCDDDEFEELQEELAEIESELGLSLRGDLLQSFDGPMVLYTLPRGQVPGGSLGGAIWVAKVSQGEALNQALQKLVQWGAKISGGQVQLTPQTLSGQTYYCWTMPALAMVQMLPTWTIVDDYLVCSTNVSLCSHAVQQLHDEQAESLADSELFKQRCAALPTQSWLSLAYTDDRVKMQDTYMGLQQIWPMATMAAAQAQVQLPFILPPIDHLIKDLEPVMSYSWEDERGIHEHLEGSTMELYALAGTSFGMGVMMPALSRARQQAFRITSATNLKQIGMGCMIYAGDHDGTFPPSLEVLVQEDILEADMLISSLREKGIDGPGYLYIASQTEANDPRNVLAYDNPAGLQANDGVNVLYVDGHVQFVPLDELDAELIQTKERLGRKLPVILQEN